MVSAEQLDEIQRDREIEGLYLANSLQQGFIYHAFTQGQVDDAYLVQTVWSYHTDVDLDALREAWHCAQRKFPSLRLRFDWRDDLVQIIDTHGTVDWRLVDLGHQAPADQEAALHRLREADRAEPFDLARGPLFRLHLVRWGPGHVTCLFSSHHAILDGWSNTVLLNYVHATYQDLVEQRPVDTSADRGYIAAQRHLQRHRHDDVDYWHAYLSRYDQRMDLQGLLDVAAVARGVQVDQTRRVRRMRTLRFTVTGERHESLTRLTREAGITTNAVFLYIWHTALRLYTASSQTISGVVLSGRGIPVNDIESAVGLLINTLPLVVAHDDPDQTVADGVRAIHRQISEFNARSSVELSTLHRGSGRLFDTLFIYENWPKIDQGGWQTWLRTSFDGEFEKLDYPLAVIVSESPRSIDVRLTYADELFDHTYLAHLLAVQRHLLDELLVRFERPAKELRFLDDEELRRHDAALNPPSIDLRTDTPFHERFAAQAARTPDRTAVTAGERSLTYRSLDDRANRLAALLGRTAALQPEQLVVCCMDKGIDLVVSMLAVMKAGGAYVPVDPSYPAERIGHILDDTATPVVLTTSAHHDRLAALAQRRARVLALDSAKMSGKLAAATVDTPRPAVTGRHLAYVLYTSGTTGLPKGVMIEHRSFCLILDAVRSRYFAERPTVSTYSVTNHVFDIFGLEYGLPLLTGGTVELGTTLPERLDCRELDFVQMTPSVCDVLLDRLTGTDDTLLLVGGEKLSSELRDRVLARAIDVVNVYGPTETTIWSTSRLYRHAEAGAGQAVGLGRPFPHETLHILDRSLRPVPVGAVGELLIGGAGLARGYLNRPELTAERFVPDPSAEPTDSGPALLYRTGDLVRPRSDGELEYLGRDDFQVKIRGHRIELGEVEAALAGCPGVRQCVVVATDSAQPMLVGYHVAADDVDPPDLLARLRRSLPSHLVPGALVRLPAVPLTISGKLDRKALPAPDTAVSRSHVPPRDRVEAEVCGIVARLLDRPGDDVGIDDDFFQLGGNSILSVKLVTAITREVGPAVTVADLLTHRTVRALMDGLGGRRSGDTLITPAANGHPEEQVLSFAQERLWFIERFEGGTNAYKLPLVFRLADGVDTAVLSGAVRDLYRRHEILRTLIRQGPDGTGHQLVQDMSAVPDDLRVVAVADRAALHGELLRQLDRVFDLSGELPARVWLHHLADSGERYLSFVIHHVAFDGWSTDVVLQDLTTSYQLRAAAGPGADPVAQLPSPSLQYRDFAAWQRGHLTGARVEDLLRFWTGRIAGYENLDLITDHSRPESVTYHGGDLHFDVDTEVSRQLRQVAAQLKVSLFSLVLSAHFLALRCFSNQDDIVVGTPFANRDHPQLERLVGFFVNTLPLRSRIDPATPVTDYVRATADEVLGALRHQELPLERLIEALNVPRDVTRHPIFQVVFGLQSFGAPPGGPDGRRGEVLRTAPESNSLYTAARFDLSTSVDDSRDRLRITVNYATSLFDEATIGSFGRTYLVLLRQFAELAPDSGDPVPTIADLAYLDEADTRHLLHDWSAPRAYYDSDALLHRLFEDQVERRPEQTALVWQARRQTYQELNAAANRLAHHLLGHCAVAPDAFVLLCLDRSDQIIVSILSTLKAGAAYVPVEPSFPDERIGFILRDTGARTVVTNSSHVDRLDAIVEGLRRRGELPADAAIEVLAVDEPATRDRIAAAPAHNPVTEVASHHLAYVLYTSGTTGVPKGVPQPHANVVRLFRSCDTVYDLRPDDVWTFFHSYVFDFTVWEMWGALLYGGRLVVPTFAETRDPALFHALCRAERVTVLCQTPTAFYQFMDVELSRGDERLDALRYVFFGGEALNVPLLGPWCARYGHHRPQFAAGYGTTETTVFTCAKLYGETDDSPTDIGGLLPDVAGYVLNPHGRPMPVGAVGELYIGGEGLAPGYLRRPELTAQRFVPNPFQTDVERADRTVSPAGRNALLYRSGDLVRWSPDGSLEFVGRNDFQVKVRGHRIELGEIETVLADVVGVRQAVVVARHRGEGTDRTYLVGYYVADRDLATGAIVDHLRTRLPEYMVPAALVRLPELPRTVSGKLDTRALPEPELSTTEDFLAPRDAREAAARDVVAQVLGVDPAKIGVLDDFFRLGGNSILSIKLAGQLSRVLDAEVSIAALFRHRTVAALVSSLTRAGRPSTTIDRLDTHDTAPLSFAQERLWFIDRYEQGTDAYNIHLVYEVLPGADLDLLERSVRAVHARHDVLRTVIDEDADGEPYQRIRTVAQAPLDIARVTLPDVRDVDAAVAREARRRFDLAHDSPFRARLHLTDDRRAFLAFFVHHIAFDGWSADVLLAELREFHDHLAQRTDGDGTPPNLPELTIQYGDFARWQRDQVSGERLADLLGYWTPRLAGHPTLNLTTDHPRPATTDYRGATVPVEFDRELSRALRRLADELQVTLFSVLLTGWYLLLAGLTGQDRLVVGVPVFNRQHRQTHDLIGCFVNSLAIDFQVDGHADLRTLIGAVAARVLDAQQHQDLPFERLVAELGLARDPGRHPLFQVWFDVHSFAETEADHDGGDTAGRGALLRTHLPTDANADQVTRFDLSADLNDGQEVLSGTFAYAVGLFERATVEGFVEVYRTILVQLAEIPAGPPTAAPAVTELRYVADRARHEMIEMGRGAALAHPSGQTLAALFRERAAVAPHHAAVVLGDTRITYGRLDELSDTLAGHLVQAYGAGPGRPIGLCLDAGPAGVVATVAIWKAGGACVPMDPRLRDDQLRHLLRDSAAGLVLCDDPHRSRLAGLSAGPDGPEVVDWDTAWARIGAEPPAAPGRQGTDEDLAYLVYAPDHTGGLLGVMLPHRAVVNHAYAVAAGYDMDDGAEVLLHLGDHAFDGAVLQVSLALLNGQTLLLADPLSGDIGRYLAAHRATSVHATPAFLAQLDPATVPSLRRLVLDGPAPVAAERARVAAAAGVDVLVEYGTALTGWSALVGAADGTARAQPHRNCHVFVLDAQRRLLPVGSVGEVYVAGPGLALGYLNQPQRTAERFVTNPFRTDPALERTDPQRGPAGREPRLHRTGRLARWRPDGFLDLVDQRSASTGVPSRVSGRRRASHRSARTMRANPTTTVREELNDT